MSDRTQLLPCPFCLEPDFDFIGLKDHLEKRCDIFRDVPTIEQERNNRIAAGNFHFHQVFCSQCGGKFGPNDHGFSSCSNHKHLTRIG